MHIWLFRSLREAYRKDSYGRYDTANDGPEVNLIWRERIIQELEKLGVK
jgi:hypothetical protein